MPWGAAIEESTTLRRGDSGREGIGNVAIGLRIDVDTYRGTKVGVPSLLRILAHHRVLATFFFSVGPDNMGRHLRRLFRPTFLWKMLRTKAPALYGWDILLRGTIRPGPIIGKRLGHVLRAARDAGHEIGLHAWDHHRWQTRIDRMGADEIRESLGRGVELLTTILGRPPCCSAVPGWKCNDLVLVEKETFGFRYNSDCRGTHIFQPLVEERLLTTPQVPIDLPTYDEAIGRNGVTPANFNDYLLSLLGPDRLNTLTLHAEVEGIACLGMFKAFLTRALERGDEFVPLGDLLDSHPSYAQARLTPGKIPGRQGWVSCQTAN